MKHKVILGFLAAAALAGSAPASAQTQGLYVGASIGQAEVSGFCDSEPGIVVTACDDKDTGWKLYAGYRANRNFAAELSYMNGGEYRGTATVFGTSGTVITDVTAWGLAALGILPVSEQLELLGKLGFIRGCSTAWDWCTT